MDVENRAGCAAVIASPIQIVVRAIEFVAAIAFFVIVASVLLGVFFRYVLNAPVSALDEISSTLFLWIAMLGAVLAFQRSEHIRLHVLLSSLSDRHKHLLDIASLILIIVFVAALIPSAVGYTIDQQLIRSPSLNLPNNARVAAIPVGLALLTLLSIGQLSRTASLSSIAVAILLAGCAIAAGMFLRPFLIDIGQWSIAIFLLGLLVLLVGMGVPIAFCFGIATLAFLTFSTNIPMSVFVGRMDEGMSGSVLLAVPLFIFLGCILDATGMGHAIVTFIASLIGHMRAGMSYALLGSLYLVSGISGSKISDMATVAPALFPEMKRRGNEPSEMVALLGTGAVVADTVPPSIMLIVLGSVAELSVGDLFSSGFVVAFFLMLILAAVARLRSPADPAKRAARASWREVRRVAGLAIPALILPVIIRGAVGEGIATATEVSTIAIVYVLALGSWLYGRIGIARLYSLAVETLSLTGSILLVMGTALAAAWAITQSGFANSLADFMNDLPGGKYSFLILSIVLFMVLGFLLEGLPALVLMAPLLFPIARELGINGIHYAMVAVCALNVGLFTPPLGIGFYLACSIGKVPPEGAMGVTWLYILALLVGILLLAFIPAISIGLL